MFILDPNRYARDPAGVGGQIPQMIEKCGGEVLASRLWNEQRLAYPIQGHRKGAYWLAYFSMEPAKVGKFNRACQLNENVLRNLTLKVEPRLVETLVAHARGEARPPDGKENAHAPTAESDTPAGEHVEQLADKVTDEPEDNVQDTQPQDTQPQDTQSQDTPQDTPQDTQSQDAQSQDKDHPSEPRTPEN
jgi:small subunit ribosomal protein S6